MAFLVIESVVFGTLSFILFSVAVVMHAWPTNDVVPERAADLGTLLVFTWGSGLGAGAYCGLMAVLAIRALDLKRALRWAVAAALLPPSILKLVGVGSMLLSPEWKASRSPARRPAPVPPGRLPR